MLVLNRHYQAVRVTSARNAFVMLYVGRVRALDRSYESFDFQAWARTKPDEHDETIGMTSGQIRVPRLVMLSTYSRVPRAKVRLSRRNVFLRDGYQCQYCGVIPPTKDLNLDHVIPRSRGGGSSWDNLVTSCRSCNLRKGRELPDECGMIPRKHPVRPAWTAAVHLVASPRRFPEWDPFLGGGEPNAKGEAAE